MHNATVVKRNHFASKSDPVSEFQTAMQALIRGLGLHRPDTTPCGQPMSVGEAHALLEIASEPGITQNGLSVRLQLEKSTVSRLVSMLERRGWVERVRSARDTRFYNLRLTSAGAKVHAKTAEARREKFQRVLRSIPPDKRDAVTASLSIILEALHEG